MKKCFIILLIFILNFGILTTSKGADLTKLKSFIDIIVSNKGADITKLNQLKGSITSTLVLAREKTKDLPATNEKKKDLLEILAYFLAKVDYAIKNPQENLAGGGKGLAGARVTLKGTQQFANYGFRNFNTTKTTTLSSMTEGALKAAIAGGGTVKIPAGTINFNGQIVLNNNTKLIGAGAGKTILSYRGGGADGIVRLSGHTNVVLQDFTLEGNNVMSKSHGIGVIGGPSKNFLIKGVHVKDIGPKERGRLKWDPHPAKSSESSGIYIGYQGGSNFTLDGNSITDVSQHSIGLQGTATSYGIVKNNYMQNSFMGIDLASGVNNVEVFNNEIEGTVMGGKFAGSRDSSFHDNYIHDLFKFSYIRAGKRESDTPTGFAYQLTGPNLQAYNNLFYGNFHAVVTSWGGASIARETGNKEIPNRLPKK